MKFLKTFFGQILRKTDTDFMQQSGRDGVVYTHSDITNNLGGVIEGLDTYVSSDRLSIVVTPGIFYNGGPVSSTNGLGGGERGEIFTTTSFTNLPNTPLIGNQQSYLVVYVKTVNQYYNPDPTKSQVIVTSKNVQTGESVPVRNYTAGSIVVSNPVLPSQFNRVGGIPLALLQVTDGNISLVSELDGVSYTKRPYVIGNVVDVLNQTVTQNAIDTVLAQVKETALINIVSSGINPWDGASAYNSLDGDGIANQHLKGEAVTIDKINAVSGLNTFSTDNYIHNGSFEITDNNGDTSIITGWDTWIATSGLTLVAGAPYGAAIEKNTDLLNVYHGTKSVKMVGADSSITASYGTNVQGLKIWQDIPFSSDNIQNTDVMASVYLKTDTGIQPGNSGYVSGITATIQFMNGTALQGDPIVIGTYNSQSATDWTRLGLSAPVQYTSGVVDGIRFCVSGTLAETSTVYIDQAYVGLTSVEPAWSSSQWDKDYSDTLVKENISTSNLTVNTQASVSQLNASNTASNIGTSTIPFNSAYIDNLYVDSITLGGGALGFGSSFICFTGSFTPGSSASPYSLTTYSWPVPANIKRISVILLGGGGSGGCGGGYLSGYAGGGGGGGEYVYTSLAVTPGDTLQIQVPSATFAYSGGPSNGGGAGSGAGSPGFVGGISKILDGAGSILATASAGGAGGNTNSGGTGGGLTSISSGMFRFAGKNGSSGDGQAGGAGGGTINTSVNIQFSSQTGGTSGPSDDTNRPRGGDATWYGTGGGGGGREDGPYNAYGRGGGYGGPGLVVIYY